MCPVLFLFLISSLKEKIKCVSLKKKYIFTWCRYVMFRPVRLLNRRKKERNIENSTNLFTIQSTNLPGIEHAPPVAGWGHSTIEPWKQFCLQHAHIHVLADFFQYQIFNTSPTQQNSMGPGLTLWPRLHKTTYWPLILMALCIIDFIGANGLLRPVGGRGPWTLPPTGPRNPFTPMKSIIHGAIRFIGQKIVI